MEDRIRLKCQVVPGDMLGSKPHRGVQIPHRARRILTRQAIHDVEIDVVEAGLPRRIERTRNVIDAVDPAERL